MQKNTENNKLKKIWLQKNNNGDQTWCEDKVNEDDIKYILESEVEEIKEAVLHDLNDAHWKWGIKQLPTMYFNWVCSFLNRYIEQYKTNTKEACDYCAGTDDVNKGTPYLADVAKMCDKCWESTGAFNPNTKEEQ